MDLLVNHQELFKNGHHLLWLPHKDTKSANRPLLLPRAVLGAIAASVPAQTRSFLHMLMSNSDEFSQAALGPVHQVSTQ